MKKILYGVLLGILITLLIAIPVLAAYYSHLTATESCGNEYEKVPLMYSRNITYLVVNDYITSSGLDTRVYTAEAEPLPHMLANDRLLFVTDLEPYEERDLIFYTGQTALSDLPIIVGYNGYITTDDDDSLEMTYVMELLASGYFDASAGADKNILYKEDAYRVYISDNNEITVAGLEVGGGEAWTMSYGSFTSGLHTVYVMSNGLAAYLYVDNFDVAKDTVNLFEASNALLSNTEYQQAFPYRRNSCYAQDKYWAFYGKGSPYVYYKTSADGLSWSSEYSVAAVGGDNAYSIDVFERGGYVYITYINSNQVEARYRRGLLNADSSITWSAAWQTAATVTTQMVGASIAVDTDGYPFVIYTDKTPSYKYNNYITKSSTNDGTWVTDGGYPLVLTSNNGKEGVAIVSYLNSNKIYALYVIVGTLYGRYYNGSSWETAETLDSGASYQYYNGVSDEDDNVYMVWEEFGNDLYFRIRYANGTFSDTVQILDADEHTYPSVAYNVDGYVYIVYTRAGSVRCVTLGAGVWTGEYTLFNPTGPYRMAAVTPYGNHIGLLYTTGAGGDTEHGFVSFPWDWNDNLNDWTWMQNNSMSYADYFIMGIDGESVLHYQPETIISGTTLPDESGATNVGAITWGSNPGCITTKLGPLIPTEGVGQPETAPTAFPGQLPSTPQDMVGPSPQPDWTRDIPTLTDHPLYPLVSIISDVTSIPIKLVWIIGATFLLVMAMIVAFRYVPHQLITILIGGGIAAFWVSMGIYPFWVLFIFAVGGLAIIIGERTQTVG